MDSNTINLDELELDLLDDEDIPSADEMAWLELVEMAENNPEDFEPIKD